MRVRENTGYGVDWTFTVRGKYGIRGTGLNKLYGKGKCGVRGTGLNKLYGKGKCGVRGWLNFTVRENTGFVTLRNTAWSTGFWPREKTDGHQKRNHRLRWKWQEESSSISGPLGNLRLSFLSTVALILRLVHDHFHCHRTRCGQQNFRFLWKIPTHSLHGEEENFSKRNATFSPLWQINSRQRNTGTLSIPIITKKKKLYFSSSFILL